MLLCVNSREVRTKCPSTREVLILLRVNSREVRTKYPSTREVLLLCVNSREVRTKYPSTREVLMSLCMNLRHVYVRSGPSVPSYASFPPLPAISRHFPPLPTGENRHEIAASRVGM